MIKMIMTDGSTSTGLTAINWADKTENLIPRINAEYGYRPKGKETYPFGKNIFEAICPSRLNTSSIKEKYCIENSDLTLIFITGTKLNIRMSKILNNICINFDKPCVIINLVEYDLHDIGILTSLIDISNYETINITGNVILSLYEQQLLEEFLTILYKMLNKEQHDYTQYITYNR